MVELTLRALFESASRDISAFWTAAQKAIENNNCPDESQEIYLKGSLRVWENLLKRLCDGCLSRDSESMFFQWLSGYRDKLSEASVCESGMNNPYMKGQVDAFNSFLRALSKANKACSPAYKDKLEQIQKKSRELDELHAELEDLMWNFKESEENLHEVPSV